MGTILTSDRIDEFRSSLIEQGLSPNTVRAYCGDLGELLRWTCIQTGLPLEMVEKTTAEWLNNTRRSTSPATTCRRLTSLKKYLEWELPGTTPLASYKAPTPGKGEPHPIPEGIPGVLAMIQVASTHEQRAMCVLTGLCGLRMAEAMDCQISWFDLHAMTLKVRGKGDKTRIVPVSKIAWSFLSGRHAELLLSGGTRYITCEERNARDTITRLAKRAHLARRVASHDLRATFATAVYDKTKDPRVVQELLGHASLTTTQIYIGVSMSAMRDGVELL